MYILFGLLTFCIPRIPKDFKNVDKYIAWTKTESAQKLKELHFIAENCRRSVTGEERLVDEREKFWMKCGHLFPPLYPNPKPIPKMLMNGCSPTVPEKTIYCALHLVFSSVNLLVCSSSFLLPSNIPSSPVGVYVSIVVQFILGLMIPFPSFRAVVLITAIKLVTSRLLLHHSHIPATNTTRNLQMLAESVACVSDSAIQIGNQLAAEINMQTNKLSLSGLKEQSRFFIKHLKNFRNIMRKLQNIIVKFGKQTKDYLVQLLKVKEYCQRFFIAPYYFCIRIFDESAQYCDRFTLYRGLQTCKFVKDMRTICDAARFSEIVCVIPEKIKESLKSERSRSGKKSWEELGISINHTIERNRTKTFRLGRMKEELEGILNQFKVFVDILSITIKFIVPNLIIVTLLMAALYVVKYKQKEKADNVYITEEFRNVDMMQEAQGQPSLLPLLPKEREIYIEGFTLRMTSKEKMRMLFAFAITLIGGFLPTVLAAGEGFMAKLLQRILLIFHPITGSQYSDDDWRQCFMEPNPPDFQLIRLMIFLYLIALLLCVIQFDMLEIRQKVIVLESMPLIFHDRILVGTTVGTIATNWINNIHMKVYVVRFRRLIVQYYWPERIKPRALWLYNQILESRKNVLTQLVKAAKEKISGRGNLVNRGLTVLGADQYRCTRCFRSDLSIADASNSRICANCNNLYCTDCYAVKKKCLECGASLQAILNETEFYVDSSCEEDESKLKNAGLTETSGSQILKTAKIRPLV
ncbi:BMA-SPE-42, isoform b [Dirofilaria immitis]|nr:BMA-SPE-42, isoform b [Dirofilaria immitis]